ncbi:MAG: hypothetical protein ACLTXP_06540 [Odoribacter splanchnicus]
MICPGGGDIMTNEEIPATELPHFAMLGELSLDGSLLAVKGTPYCYQCQSRRFFPYDCSL